MCLNIQGHQAEVLTAADDITVYKVITRKVDGDSYEAVYENYVYSTTDVMVAENFFLTADRVRQFDHFYDRNGAKLSLGFHSFIKLEDATELFKRLTLHKSNNGWFNRVNLMVAKFIIPKGTQYIIGRNDDYKDNYLSEKFQFVEVVEK